MSFRQRVLAAGYFPKELPPPFTTVPFADFAAANPTYIQNPWRPFPPDQGYVTKLVRHHRAEVGRNRRILSIPNPINQLRLVQVMEANFAPLFTAARASPISASKPRFQYNERRAIETDRNFSTIPALKARARAVARHILKSDVTRFYPSIYTHSISWALHTKAVAKADHGPTLFGNVIDKVVREAQDGQTLGLPIGPDTSLVIAEVILSAVDKEVLANSTGYRWYDDYELSGVTRGICEQELVRLETGLFNFELEVNVAKTEIKELPLPVEEEWVSVLRSFQFPSTARAQMNSLNDFFSRAFEFAGRFSSNPVLRYAVRKLHGADIQPGNWNHTQRLMAQAASHEPDVLPLVLGCLNFYHLRGLPLDSLLLQTLLVKIVEDYAARKIGNEVAWAIWGFLQFRMPIPEPSVRAALSLDDDVVSLLLLDARRKGLVGPRNILRELGTFVNKTAFEDEHWLLAYEAIRKGWLRPGGSGAADFRADPHVAALIRSGVTFYDANWRPDATAKHWFGTPPWLWYLLPEDNPNEDLQP